MTRENEQWLMRMIQAACPDGLSGRNVTIWGVMASNESVDSKAFLRWLVDQEANVTVYDERYLDELPRAIAVSDHPHDALQTSDLLIVLSGWPGYENCEPGALRWFVRTPLAIDLPGRFDVQKMANGGFVVASSSVKARRVITPRPTFATKSTKSKGYSERNLAACSS